MFTVIEFEHRKCSVVPISWLTDENEACLWPNVSKEKTLLEYIKSKKSPQASWKKFKVIKIHYVTADYTDANNNLEKILEESSSSEANGNSLPLAKCDFNVNNDDEDTFPSPCSLELTKTTNDSSSKNNKKSSKQNNASVRKSMSEDEFSEEEHHSFASASTTTVSTVSNRAGASSLDLPQGVSSLLEVILAKVECIKAVQDQQSIMLNNIERNQQTSSIQQLQRPANMPTLPVSSKQEYRALEEFLIHEDNALYMRRRLAAIGGSSVRNTVMNILKFVLSNKVAMKFSWSGREKRAFRDTKIMGVINEAVKLSYSGREPADLNDTSISNAVKDWLKLAKHRYLYSKK